MMSCQWVSGKPCNHRSRYTWWPARRLLSLSGTQAQAAPLLCALLLGLALTLLATPLAAAVFPTPTRSTNIALSSNDRFLLVVNRDKDSLSVLEVLSNSGQDIANKLAEIAVGQEPRCVAVLPDDSKVYVTNAISGTVSVISFTSPKSFGVVNEIQVGNEPRGCALTPNGTVLYVANHTDGTVSAINTSTDTVIRDIVVGGNPMAIAITNNGDDNDRDELVFVTLFFAEAVPGGPGEGFDNGRRAVVRSFQVLNNANFAITTLSPLAISGFTSTRAAFCPNFNPLLHSDIFCPDTSITDATDPQIAADPQGAFPNQLFAALIRGTQLFIPSIGAAPEPPVQFNANVQALVHQVNTTTRLEDATRTQNLNAQIAQEPFPANALGSLQHTFLDPVAIDADRNGNNFFIVSRGGNFVVQARLGANGQLDLNVPDVVRFETGNIPTGVVISRSNRRAYINNEVDLSVTRIDLETGAVIAGDIPSSEPPDPGTFEHARQIGKLAFFTSLGVPDNGIFSTPSRDIDPKQHRGKASRDAWSSCGSCHPDGLSDNVTWIFDTGPRQTIGLDAFTSKHNPADQRLSNWSAVRTSNTEFNLNSRNVQGGCGFASDEFAPPEACNTTFNLTPQHPGIFNLGLTEGVSDALDAWSLWVQTVRTLNMPQPTNPAALNRGRTVFAEQCASCHGGPKWTKSQIIFASNPTLLGNGGVPRDEGLTVITGQLVSYTEAGLTLPLIDKVGTFSLNNDLELRGLGLFGQRALGTDGFNPPSLLQVRYTAPYLHNGGARNLSQVFNIHTLPDDDGDPANDPTIADSLLGSQLQDLTVFLNAIDSRTRTFDSATDQFLEDIFP